MYTLEEGWMQMFLTAEPSPLLSTFVFVLLMVQAAIQTLLTSSGYPFPHVSGGMVCFTRCGRVCVSPRFSSALYPLIHLFNACIALGGLRFCTPLV